MFFGFIESAKTWLKVQNKKFTVDESKRKNPSTNWFLVQDENNLNVIQGLNSSFTYLPEWQTSL